MARTAGKAESSRTTDPTDTTNVTSKRLAAFFCIWKALLVLIAVASPGPGYDTSTQILLSSDQSPSGSWLERLVSRLTRWDAIYFVTASKRGHLYEQESAFSISFARVTSVITRVFPFGQNESALTRHAFAGIVVSHLSHFFAVILLYRLTYEIIPGGRERKSRIAFTAACLHAVSPGGLFLSASYGESSFALAHFAGLLCYVIASQHSHDNDVRSALIAAFWTLMSGMFIEVATLTRSNGLLSGLILAWDATLYIPKLPSIIGNRDWTQAIRLGGTLLGGLLIAVGYVLPQAEAYLEYCTGGNTREWCSRTPPSIYSFVQTHYWNVGFLRYWTLSNLPLFALATPMLLVMIGTGWAAMSSSQLGQVIQSISAGSALKTSRTDLGPAHPQAIFRSAMARFALPQIALAVMAFTSFHVQIINRISSGYPVWYIMVAIGLCADLSTKTGQVRMLSNYAHWLVRASVMYAIIQGGLYASFMPPA